MKRALLTLVVVAAAAYAADFAVLRVRMATKRNPFGTVTRNVFYTVKLKNGKTEIDYAGQQDFECPNTLLPQYGEKPCWLARRQKDQQIDIDSGNPHNPSLF